MASGRQILFQHEEGLSNNSLFNKSEATVRAASTLCRNFQKVNGQLFIRGIVLGYVILQSLSSIQER